MFKMRGEIKVMDFEKELEIETEKLQEEAEQCKSQKKKLI